MVDAWLAEPDCDEALPEVVAALALEPLAEEPVMLPLAEDAEPVEALTLVIETVVALPVGLAVERALVADVIPRVTCEVLYATVVSLSSTKYGVKFV